MNTEAKEPDYQNHNRYHTYTRLFTPYDFSSYRPADRRKEYLELLARREDEFTTQISIWFDNHKDFLSAQVGVEEDWNEGALDAFKTYKDAVIEGVDSVKYSDYIGLFYFEEDYDKDLKRVSISAGIIVN